MNQPQKTDCRRGAFVAGFALAAFSLVGIAKAAEKLPYAPTSDYNTRKIAGWTVLVNKDFAAEHAKLHDQSLVLLQHQLYQIERLVSAEAVEQLRRIKIWLEFAEPHHPCAAYHPDVDWLRKHDMNSDKAKCVEIANAKNFLAWTRSQPWMVLHELAHGYHDQFLGGFDNAEILAAYRQAMKMGSYDSVLRLSGRNEKAYAATNQMEYFAEASEAFFGVNDFYPYVRSELQQHDPQMFRLLHTLWRTPPRK